MKTAILAAVAAASVAVPAYAQEAGSFAGPHAEVLAGYDSLDTNSVAGTPDGFLYGLGLGYDFQAGSIVYGVEAEVSDSTTERTVAGVKLESDRDLYAGGRLGYAMGDTALLYAKVGYTNARIDVDGDGSNGDGIRAGAGLDYKLGGNLFLRGEYRYSNYEADIERHQILGGVGIRF